MDVIPNTIDVIAAMRLIKSNIFSIYLLSTEAKHHRFLTPPALRSFSFS